MPLTVGLRSNPHSCPKIFGDPYKIVSLTLCLLLLFVATAAASLLLQSKISEHSQEWWMAKRRDCRVTSASAPGQISKTYRCGSTSLATTGSRSAASHRRAPTRVRLRCLDGRITGRPDQQAPLGLWNALPGIEQRKKIGDRDMLIDRIWGLTAQRWTESRAPRVGSGTERSGSFRERSRRSSGLPSPEPRRSAVASTALP